ncbi:hypothetical protein KR074_004207 [Drosophila pseudoananassae]|nr:hypothetical protein KR074_004207 [Drosophila pseudoananassae]
MSGSEDSIEYFLEEGPNHTPGPVSPNSDLLTSQPTNFSSSISNTSVDGSYASESVTSEPVLLEPFPFVATLGRSRYRERVRSHNRSRGGAYSDVELADLRTVPASTNLRPQDRNESGRRLGNRRRWASRTRSVSPLSIAGRRFPYDGPAWGPYGSGPWALRTRSVSSASSGLPFPYDGPAWGPNGAGLWPSRTSSVSPASSSSGSGTRSPLPPHIAEYARELRGNGEVPTFRAATIAFHVSQMVIDIESRLPMTPERLRRIRRHRRIQARARGRAQSVLNELMDFTTSSSDNESERRPPRYVPRQVRRRGNSVSDCSQCSSDEESNGKKSKPDPLEEWLYPV